MSAQPFRERLFERYGIEPSRVDVEAAELLLTKLELDEHDPAALEASLVSAAVNGESHFLRHHEQFEWLASTWLPAACARARARPPGQRTLRILSAACSTGEEPYSVAATLGPLTPPDLRLEILAFDISEQALAVARAGQYCLWSMRALEPDSHGWLRLEGSHVLVHDWVKAPVRFARHNLLEPLDAFGRFDLVLCRNAMIYFHPDAIARAWTNLAAALAEQGDLLTAPADPPPPAALGLYSSWVDAVCVYTLEPPDAESRAAPPEDRAPAYALASPTPIDERYATILGLVRVGELELARALLVELAAEAPLSAPRHLLLALVAGELGELELSTEHARKASFIEPDEPYPAFVMATALERMGHTKQARARYEWALELLAKTDPRQALAYADGILAGQLQELLHARS